MANYILVRHKVQDYDAWRPAYDAHQPTRAQAGLTDKMVLRSADDPNNVFILFEAADLDRARAFAASDDLRQTMQKGGVIDHPDVNFLKG